MSREICNPQHLGQITHIDTITNTLVCANDIPLFQSTGANLVPIHEYAAESAELVRSICNDSHILLSKLESAKSTSNTLSMKDKIERAFQKYIEFIYSVKDELNFKLTRTSVNSNPALANEFCKFAEKTSLDNISLRKAIINNDYMEIRKYSDKQSLTQLKEMYTYYEQNLFKTNFSPNAGFEVMFKEAIDDPDTVLNQVGISLIGFQATSLKESHFLNLSPGNSEQRVAIPNMPAASNSFSLSQSPPKMDPLLGKIN